jgi:hypothetical protein
MKARIIAVKEWVRSWWVTLRLGRKYLREVRDIIKTSRPEDYVEAHRPEEPR